MEQNIVITFLACIIFLFIIGKLFVFPVMKILKVLLNSILGGALIYIINLVGTYFEFHIGLNVVTAILVGILGIPGAVLLVLLKMLG